MTAPQKIGTLAFIEQSLRQLYSPQDSERLYEIIRDMITTNLGATQEFVLPLSERDAIVIAYGDHVTRPGEAPLATLYDTLVELDAAFTGLHILPFYPYSSDDGFSVIDYYAVDEHLGTWNDIDRLRQRYRLMFDAVLNHCSAQSAWFKAFLRGEAPYDRYFITMPPDTDLSKVVRPRTHPVLTPFETVSGTKYVWTTFSTDQVDLNVANPDVLLELLRILLFYVQRGAQMIRLDAIAYLWKEVGTTCIHLPQTHLIIQIIRKLIDRLSPRTILITETNVPHEENISYFGRGDNQAQMVYQFALPPLILHTMITGNTQHLSRWAASIRPVSDKTTYFNFTSSHDGIGVRGVQGILSKEEINALVRTTQEHGGLVSYRSRSDGTQSPYELNITFFDAINHPDLTRDQPDVAVQRFLVSQAIKMAMVGVPGIYFGNLFGARNNLAGVRHTGRNRTINREKFDHNALLAEISGNTLKARVLAGMRRLLVARTTQQAFHPLAEQIVLALHPGVFAVERLSRDGQQRIFALHNVTGEPVTVALNGQGRAQNLFSRAAYDLAEPLTLEPYGILWLAQ